MGAKNQHRTVGHVIDRLYKNRTTAAQLLYYVGVMDNFMMDIYGCPIGFQSQFHNVHGAHHARAEPSGSDP
jgi:hypothetical protein